MIHRENIKKREDFDDCGWSLFRHLQLEQTKDILTRSFLHRSFRKSYPTNGGISAVIDKGQEGSYITNVKLIIGKM